MADWAEEKRALEATIRRQERDAARLARRFKLLQRTVVEQQALLDQYQRALQRQTPSGDRQRASDTEAEAEEHGAAQKAAGAAGERTEAAWGNEGASGRAPEERLVSAESEDEKEAGSPKAEGEDKDERLEETATCLSPPLAVVEGSMVVAADLGGARDPAILSPPAAQVAPLVPSDPNQRKERQPAALSDQKEEKAAQTDTTGGEEPCWTRRRRPGADSDWMARQVASCVSADATDATAAPPPSAATAAPRAKRPRAAPAKWADVKKQRAARGAAASTRAAPAAASARDKKNEQFAYVEVVRNREARAALPAHECAECAKYYAALGDLVTPEQVAEHKRACSRHRARYEPYETPDDFWRLTFPDSESTT